MGRAHAPYAIRHSPYAIVHTPYAIRHGHPLLWAGSQRPAARVPCACSQQIDVDFSAEGGTRAGVMRTVENRKDGYHWAATPRIPKPMLAAAVARSEGDVARETSGSGVSCAPSPGRSRALSTAIRRASEPIASREAAAAVQAARGPGPIQTCQTWWYRMELVTPSGTAATGAHSRGELGRQVDQDDTAHE